MSASWRAGTRGLSSRSNPEGSWTGSLCGTWLASQDGPPRFPRPDATEGGYPVEDNPRSADPDSTSPDSTSPGSTPPDRASTARPRDRQKPRRRRRSSTSLDARGRRVHRELQAILVEILDRKGLPRDRARGLNLRFETLLDAAAGDGTDARKAAQSFAARLVRDIQILADETAAPTRAFPYGRVRCFWCGSFECEHASPPEPRAVFRGFNATGQPIWVDLATLALERHHPRVDELYESPSAPITLLQNGRSLSEDQLGIFGKGSKDFRVLGQVVVGYLPPRRGRDERRQQALTIQAVETWSGVPRHDLNVVGVLPDGRAAATFLEEVASPRLLDAVAAARDDLREISLLSAAGRKPAAGGARARSLQNYADRERLALKVLGRLERTVERIYRQNARRTRHARDHHRDRERPTSTALKDALNANLDAVYRDVEERTWVVIGPRQRVHIFNDRGEHVTSVVYPGDVIRKRTTRGKWRRGEREDAEAFLERMRTAGRT